MTVGAASPVPPTAGLAGLTERVRLLILVVLAAVVGAFYCAATQWPLWSRGEITLAGGNLLVCMSFMVSAVFVAAGGDHRGTALGLAATAVVWPLNWLNEWNKGPLILIAELIGPAGALCAIWALLRYPLGWSRAGTERLIIAALIGVQLLAALPVITSRPQWHGFPADNVWLTIVASRSAFAVAQVLYHVGGAVVAVVAAGALLVRLIGLPARDRAIMRPVAAAIVLAGTLAAFSNIAAARPIPGLPIAAVYAAEQLGYVCVPVAFALATARRWLAQDAVTMLLRGMGDYPTPFEAQAVLRRVLSDPTLQLLYQLPDGLVAADGARRRTVEEDGSRVAAAVPVSSGAQVLLITRDPLLAGYRALVHRAAAATALTLDNTVIQAAIAAQIHEVEQSASRLASAVETERRYIQSRVSQIGQIQLGAVRQQLERLREDPAPNIWPPTKDDVPSVAASVEVLDRARAELSRLSSGLGVDLAAGVATTLAADVHRLAPDAQIDITLPELPPSLAQTVYFVITELVTNAVKHAPRAGIDVRTQLERDELVLMVTDTGPGGADVNGAGLQGVKARLSAVGGTLQVASPSGGGTTAAVRLPRPVI